MLEIGSAGGAGDLLKKTGSGNLFIAFGEPEVKVKDTKDGMAVEIVGVDIYDPVKSEIRSRGSGDPEHEIAAWFIDTNYNGESFFVTHAYFLGANKPYEKLKKALRADINEDAWEELFHYIAAISKAKNWQNRRESYQSLWR